MYTAEDIQALAGDNYINTDELISLEESVAEERQGIVDAIEEAICDLEKADWRRELDLWDKENGDAWKDLKSVTEQLPEGETMISDGKINSYLGQLAYDLGDIPKNLPSYLSIEIDFGMLKQDYSEIEYGGTTYWVLST